MEIKIKWINESSLLQKIWNGNSEKNFLYSSENDFVYTYVFNFDK